MTRDDLALVAAVVFAGGLVLMAISYLAGCSASLPYGRPGQALYSYIETHVHD
jgi:hypothetical protein